ncbi:MAG: helix-turn-helix domain containing protein [Lachnospiraceae bacterium]|nr:helix-turn-helix domain containing protein [Lachnospiraceae bacterium]
MPVTSDNMISNKIYALICRSDGIKAKDIAKELKVDRTTVNRLLYCYPFIHDLCYRDKDYRWHGYIRQVRPHIGLGEYSGYYSTVKEFLELSEEEWFETLKAGCKNIGRNLNDTRGLFHSFKDARETMVNLFADLKEHVDYGDWEIVFELRIKRSKAIRIYADVLVITDRYVFSLEFKMKDIIEAEEVLQAGKYCQYQEVIFGGDYDVIPVLVLTRATDLYTYVPIGKSTAELPVCSGDMLFNIFDEYLEFLKQ